MLGAFTWLNFAMRQIRSNAGKTVGGTPVVDRCLGEINSCPVVQRALKAAKIGHDGGAVCRVVCTHIRES
jgi:hypothetical protein